MHYSIFKIFFIPRASTSERTQHRSLSSISTINVSTPSTVPIHTIQQHGTHPFNHVLVKPPIILLKRVWHLHTPFPHSSLYFLSPNESNLDPLCPTEKGACRRKNRTPTGEAESAPPSPLYFIGIRCPCAATAQSERDKGGRVSLLEKFCMKRELKRAKKTVRTVVFLKDI